MTGCIVGWAHTQVRQARGARHRIADRRGRAGRARRCRRRGRRYRPGLSRHDERRLRQAGVPGLAGVPGRPGLPLQAGDPRRERLRHRLGGDPYGPQHDRRRQGAARAGRRRREDDRAVRRRGQRRAAARLLPQGGGQYRGRLRRHLRPDRAEIFPALRRPVRRAGPDRRQEPQERRRQPAGADAARSRLRILPHRVGEEPDRRRPA